MTSIPRLFHGPDCFPVSTPCTYTDLGSRGYFGVYRRSCLITDECQNKSLHTFCKYFTSCVCIRISHWGILHKSQPSTIWHSSQPGMIYIPRLFHGPDCFPVSTPCTYTDLGSRGYFGVYRRSCLITDECQKKSLHTFCKYFTSCVCIRISHWGILHKSQPSTIWHSSQPGMTCLITDECQKKSLHTFCKYFTSCVCIRISHWGILHKSQPSTIWHSSQPGMTKGTFITLVVGFSSENWFVAKRNLFGLIDSMCALV